MISFACKKIEIIDLIKCSFNLNKTDYLVFSFLMQNNGDFTINHISKNIGLERSGVQKAVKKLVSINLINRHQLNLDKGGYQFFYSVNDKKNIKDRIESIIDNWHLKVKDEIKNWG